MSKINITGQVSAESRAKLDQIKADQGFTNYGQVLEFLLEQYHKGSIKPSKVSAHSGKEYFHVQVDPRALEQMEQVRQFYFEEKGFKDPQILYHFLRREKKLRENKAFLVEPAPKIRSQLLEAGQPAIDNGDARDFGEFISKSLRKIFSSKPKSGLFG